VGGVGEQRLRHINDSVLSSLKMEGIRFFLSGWYCKRSDLESVSLSRRFVDVYIRSCSMPNGFLSLSSYLKD
jgi:hypothetical protein